MNRRVILATVLIAILAAVRQIQNNKPVTPVIVGAWIFGLLLSLLDIFGGMASEIAGALAMLALLTMFLLSLPVFKSLLVVNVKTSAVGSSTVNGKVA